MASNDSSASGNVDSNASNDKVSLSVVTRGSPLAVIQTEMAIKHLSALLPDHGFEMRKLVTTGDAKENWSLEEQGGAGLFTSELERSLLEGQSDIAIHSAKDMPTELKPGLAIAGYLPRGDARDVMIVREDLARPNSIATSSPRRRNQLQRQFTKAEFLEIRGNVETRLQKIVDGYADATVLAAAGLQRLGISEWPGLRFQMLPLAVCVPAVGQGAIAVQTRIDLVDTVRPLLDMVTGRAVGLERRFLRALGGGCHTAFAVHFDGNAVHIYHDACSFQRFSVTNEDLQRPAVVVEDLIGRLRLNV